MRGRKQISELAEFSIISQQRGSDKRYLPDKDTVWIIRGNTTMNLDYTNYKLNVGDYFLRFIFIDTRRDSSVGIAARYGLDGLGIESRWGGKIFRTRVDRSWGPSSLLYQVSFPVVKLPGAWL